MCSAPGTGLCHVGQFTVYSWRRDGKGEVTQYIKLEILPKTVIPNMGYRCQPGMVLTGVSWRFKINSGKGRFYVIRCAGASCITPKWNIACPYLSSHNVTTGIKPINYRLIIVEDVNPFYMTYDINLAQAVCKHLKFRTVKPIFKRSNKQLCGALVVYISKIRSGHLRNSLDTSVIGVVIIIDTTTRVVKHNCLKPMWQRCGFSNSSLGLRLSAKN